MCFQNYLVFEVTIQSVFLRGNLKTEVNSDLLNLKGAIVGQRKSMTNLPY